MLPKTILITGATDGLGKATAEALARQGHTLLLHGRDQGRLDRMAHALQTTVRTYRADFSTLQQVRDLADAVLAPSHASMCWWPTRGSAAGLGVEVSMGSS